MRTLVNACRRGFDTKLKWLIFDDNQYSGQALTLDRETVEVSSDDLPSWYTGHDGEVMPSMKLSVKVTPRAISTKKSESSTTEASKKSKKKKKMKESVVVVKEESPVAEDTVESSKPILDIFPTTELFVLVDPDSDFRMEVEGTRDDAEKALKEYITRHPRMTIEHRVIRAYDTVVDNYTIMRVIDQKGTVIHECDYDDATTAVNDSDEYKKKGYTVKLYLVAEALIH